MTAQAAPRPVARPGGLSETATGLLRSMRPRQWPKNDVVLVGLVFARELGRTDQVLSAVVAVLLFCLLSGAVYLVNDLMDVGKDRLHPVKRSRPLASGRLSPAAAALTAALSVAGGLAAAYALSPPFFGVAAGYLGLQALYLAILKHAVILDVLALAAGFVLLAVAGAVVVDVQLSP